MPATSFYLASLLLGLGSGSLTPVVVASLQSSVEERYLGVASSLPGFARAIAQTIGTSALGAFLAVRLLARLRSEVAPIASPGVRLEEFIESPNAIRALPEVMESAVVEAYRGALSETFVAMIVVVTAALAATRLMRDPSTGSR